MDLQRMIEKLKCMELIFGLALSWVFFSGAPAKADTISFSFTNTIGTTAGTVTGYIVGLTDNATTSASDVIITSFPASLEGTLPPLPIDASIDGFLNLTNTFTEAGGIIISANYNELEQVPATNSTGRFNLQLGDPNTLSELLDYNAGLSIDGPITYGSSPSPEMSSVRLLLSGMSGMGLLFGKRRIKRPAIQ